MRHRLRYPDRETCDALPTSRPGTNLRRRFARGQRLRSFSLAMVACLCAEDTVLHAGAELEALPELVILDSSSGTKESVFEDGALPDPGSATRRTSTHGYSMVRGIAFYDN